MVKFYYIKPFPKNPPTGYQESILLHMATHCSRLNEASTPHTWLVLRDTQNKQAIKYNPPRHHILPLQRRNQKNDWKLAPTQSSPSSLIRNKELRPTSPDGSLLLPTVKSTCLYSTTPTATENWIYSIIYSLIFVLYWSISFYGTYTQFKYI